MSRENKRKHIFSRASGMQKMNSVLLEQYFETFKDIFDLCILTDKNGILINATSYANIDFAENKPLLHFVDIPYKNELKKAIATLKKGVNAKFNIRFIRSSKIFKVKCTIVKDEDANKYLLFTFLDNTKLNELSTNLMDSENRFRTIVNYTASWENWISPAGDLLFINPAVKKITGYSFEESIWLFQHPKKYIFKEDSKRIVEKIINSLREETSGNDIFRLIKKDKTIIWLSSQWNPVYGKDGDYQGLRLSLHDITKIKSTQQLLEENLKLFKKVNKELKEANIKIEETSKAGKIFLANMSHLARTPLNAILGMTELLYGSSLTSEQQEMVEIIEYSAENLSTVINDVVDIKKLELNKIILEKKGFKFYEKIISVFNVLKEEAKRKNLSYIFTYPEQFKGLVIKSDPVRLSQIIFNLLNNAVKYTNKGSVKLEIMIKKASATSVSISFTISDTGIGISEDNQLLIFDGFLKPETQVAKKIEGSGLGLFISKKLVNMMHGTINVSSVEGRGSVFSVCFEFEKAEKIEVPDRKNFKINIKEKQKELQNVSILLVEDQEFNQLLIKKITDSWMCKLDIAINGQNAIEMLSVKKYDIVLMDIQLPVMSGLQATKIIRNEMPEPIKSIPIIALTANALEGDNEKYKAAGMNDYLAKPFQSQVLYKMILQNLKKGRQVRLSNSEAEINDAEHSSYSLEKILEIAKGDESYIREMIRVFIDQCVEVKKDMNDALMNENLSELGELAHKLKSSVNIMCLTNIEKPVFKVVELARTNGEKKQIISLSETIIDELETIIPELTTELEKRL
ncbi:MAG: response regulator [Chlorobi bacterium]|nr:response regulator [Chlorobiota bacterium]